MTATQSLQQEGMVSDRVALVTGGTRGIGAAICRRLASEGASIAAGYWRQDEGAEKFRAAMAGEHPELRCTLHEGNIGLADDCRRVVREVIEQHGRLDILVNNAGITIDRTVAKIPIGRLGRPEEIARVVCFLAADQSAYITGQIWAVNGGLDM